MILPIELTNQQILIAAGAVVAFALILRRGSSKKAIVDPNAEAKKPKRNIPRKVLTGRTGDRYLVIGGAGMLGSHIVEGLLARGETDVRIFDRVINPIFNGDEHVTSIVGDITNFDEVVKACEGVQTVIMTAAVISYYTNLAWDQQPSFDVNIRGSHNVVEACVAQNVQRLLYTSTDTVCLTLNRKTGKVEETGLDESAPYATEFFNHYIPTKIAGEKIALNGNGKNGLAVVVMRPSGMWGPRDKLMTETFLEPEAVGIGKADGVQDFAYVENVVHGFFCAERSLRSREKVAAGKAYNIGNGFYHSYLDFNTSLAEAMKTKFSIIPAPIVYFLAYVSRFLSIVFQAKFTHPLRVVTPQTLYIARGSFKFSTERAKKELGWEAPYSHREALDIIAAHYGKK